MLKKCRNILRNEKGLTLIELLAVVVILGIIAAIAVPSIGGLIDNSKKDAHVANAQQFINAAKLAQATTTTTQATFTLADLTTKNYLESIKDPDTSTTYLSGTVTFNTTTGKLSSVKLVGENRTVEASADATTGIITFVRDTHVKNTDPADK